MRISDWSSDVCASDLLAPARVGDRPGHALALEHPGDRQILDIDRLVLADQSSGQLMQEVLPRMTHGRMGTANLRSGLRSVLRSLLFARQAALRIGGASCSERGCPYV